MKRKNLPLFLLLAAAGVGVYLLTKPTPPPPPPTKVPPVVKPAPAQKIKLYFFTQQGCQPCSVLKKSMQNPIVQEELARFDLQEVTPGDAKYQQYKVNGTPTLVALGTKGTQTKVGAMSSQELFQWLQGIK